MRGTQRSMEGKKLAPEEGFGMSALVLTAGGARGAYQAGVLKRIGELASVRNRPTPFSIITGASAGAITGAALAAGSAQFSQATELIADLWASIQAEDVYRTDLGSLVYQSGVFLKDISMGGILGGGQAQSFLDATPLRHFLLKRLPFHLIEEAIQRQHLYALAVTATNYYSGKSFTFVQGQEGHPTWERSRKISLSAKLTVSHLCASAAIPVIFQPVLVPTPEGDFYFGDGGLRLVAPIGPAIRLGASRIFAIGIRHHKVEEQRHFDSFIMEERNRIVMQNPPLAQVFGVILNSIFLDHLDTDVEHLIRINQIIQKTNPITEAASNSGNLKEIDPLVINPSVDIAEIAELYSEKLPYLVRYLLDGLGRSRSETADLVSYLLFHSEYTQDLVQLGYRDAHEKIQEIEHFLINPQRATLLNRA